MKRALALAAAVAICLGLAGCKVGMDVEKMREIAEAKEVCAELGGHFEQWPTDLGPNWRCDFSDPEPEEGAR